MQYNGSLSLHPFARYAATSALHSMASFFFFQAEDGIRDIGVTGVQNVCSSDLAPSLGGESFGMVLTEAFAAGTPVIASDIPGYRDVVRDGVNGTLVAPGDALGLAESLRDRSEERRVGKECRARWAEYQRKEKAE